MGKDSKSSKAGRNTGDDLAKRRRTERHRESFTARQARVRSNATIRREQHYSGLDTVALKVGAPQPHVLHRPTPTRIKRDLVKFITDRIADTREQRSTRLRYTRMSIGQFITHINAKLAS